MKCNCECHEEAGLEWYVEREDDPPHIKNWGRKGNQLMLDSFKFWSEMRRQSRENPDRTITVKTP